MSLLMDALKRAEKAREAQAVKGGAPDAKGAAPSELALDPIDDVDSAAPQASETSLGSDTDDSLELTPDDVKRQIESMDDSAVDAFVGGLGGLELEKSQPLPATSTARDDNAALEYGDIVLDETGGSTLPSMRSAQRSVQDYFDGTHSMSMSMEEVREHTEKTPGEAAPEQAAPQAGETEGGNTTSQRRAQAVLDAQAHAPSHLGRNIAWLLLVLLLVGGAGGGVFFFKDQIMAVLDGQPSLVAQRPQQTAPPVGVNDARPPAPGTMSAMKADTMRPLAADEREALLRAAEQARAEEAARVQAQMKAEADARAAAEMQARAAADAAAAQAEIEAQAQAEAEAQAQAQAQAKAEIEAQRQAAVLRSAMGSAGGAQRDQLAGALADDMGMAPAAFKISRRRGPGRTHKALVRGFEAFQRGDDGVAMNAYLAVLKREPRNRDAMLGVAAVSMRAGAVEQAAGYYMELLRRNPRDATAQAALIALQDNLDPVSAQSRVKDLLARAPDDPNLHFSLGNLYAEQGRWPEAQQSYFEAYRLDELNPDYAFNLAVSLDQLAQYKSALEYYRRAEALAGEHPATFDLASAQRRAMELAGS